MNNDRPIVFTITEYMEFGSSRLLYDVKTSDTRGAAANLEELLPVQIFIAMRIIAEKLNNKGYAVLFEVD
jgi:hypothetical protein